MGMLSIMSVYNVRRFICLDLKRSREEKLTQ